MLVVIVDVMTASEGCRTHDGVLEIFEITFVWVGSVIGGVIFVIYDHFGYIILKFEVAHGVDDDNEIGTTAVVVDLVRVLDVGTNKVECVVIDSKGSARAITKTAFSRNCCDKG